MSEYGLEGGIPSCCLIVYINSIGSVASSWDLDRDKRAALKSEPGTVAWQHIGTLCDCYMLGHAAAFVNPHKDLGVLLDSTLTFHSHTRSIDNKTSGLSTVF